MRVLVEDDQLRVKDTVQVDQDVARPQETGHHRHLPLHHPSPPHRPLHPPLLQIHKLLPCRHRIINHFFYNDDFFSIKYFSFRIAVKIFIMLSYWQLLECKAIM